MHVANRIRDMMAELTAGERKVGTALLADYPFAGLLTVAELAKRSNVSGQTILRLTSKLGYSGYTQFQQALIGEIKDGYHSPIILKEARNQSSQAPQLADFVAGAIASLQATATYVSDEQVDEIAALLSDPKRSLFLIGGRITDSLATYFFHHLRQIRDRVYKIPGDHEEWPEYLLRMGKQDIVVMFDFRRYQPGLSTLAKSISDDRNGKIILITDKWMSPAAKHSTHILPCAIDVGTPWDTGISSMLLIEVLINKIADIDWPKTRKRIAAWDGLRVS